MKDYQFEYNDQAKAFKLMGISIGLVILGFYLILGPFRYTFQQPPVFLIGLLMLLPILTTYIFKNKIKKYGSAVLYESYVIINLSNNEKKIYFKDINQYYIYHSTRNGGVVFTLYLSDKTTLKITCNKTFCKPKLIENFLIDFKRNIEVFNINNNCNIPQLKTVLAKWFGLYILAPLTILIIPFIFFIPFPLKIVIIGMTCGLFAAWIIFLKARLKK